MRRRGENEYPKPLSMDEQARDQFVQVVNLTAELASVSERLTRAVRELAHTNTDGRAVG